MLIMSSQTVSNEVDMIRVYGGQGIGMHTDGMNFLLVDFVLVNTVSNFLIRNLVVIFLTIYPSSYMYQSLCTVCMCVCV